MIRSGPKRASTLHLLAGSSTFASPISAVTFPGTTVIARTSSSGEFRASIKASASSLPGSVSKMIFFAAFADEENESTRDVVNRNIASLERERETPFEQAIFISQNIDA